MCSPGSGTILVMTDFKAFTLRLPADVYDQARAVADGDSRSLTNWVARLVRAELARQKAQAAR